MRAATAGVSDEPSSWVGGGGGGGLGLALHLTPGSLLWPEMASILHGRPPLQCACMRPVGRGGGGQHCWRVVVQGPASNMQRHALYLTQSHTHSLSPSPHTLLLALAPADHVQDEYNTSKFCSSCETELKTTGSRTKACPNPSCSASWNRDVNGTWPLAATVGLPVHHLCWALCTCS